MAYPMPRIIEMLIMIGSTWSRWGLGACAAIVRAIRVHAFTCMFICWFHVGIDSLSLDHSVTPSLPSQLKFQGCPRVHCTAIVVK